MALHGPTGPVNVLLIGSGAREHAIATALCRSPRLGRLWVTQGANPGLAAIGRVADVPVSIREIYRLVQFCDREQIGLVVVGPEDPLAEGYADRLAGPGRLVFGPGAEGARIESDKGWAKQLMRSASVPTAEARVFTDAEAARVYVEAHAAYADSSSPDPVLARLAESVSRLRDPADRRREINEARRADRSVAAAYDRPCPGLPVLKAAGLAKGKGVALPDTLAEAIDTIDRIMVRREFGDAGRSLVAEERLEGPELSVLALVDGRTIQVLPPCQDYKRLLDGGRGPNTGGMGAFGPSPLADAALMEQVEREILVPTVDGLRRDGIDYRGVLYAGLMLTRAGPKVLEFNCRFGDPECQVLLTLLKSDLLDAMIATATGRLDGLDVAWAPGAACAVVLASGGYPESPRKGAVITGLDEAGRVAGATVYHAGTALDKQGRVVADGGRVLCVTAGGDTLPEARERAYRACSHVRFDGMQMRSDIGA